MFNRKKVQQLERDLSYAMNGWATMLAHMDPFLREGYIKSLEETSAFKDYQGPPVLEEDVLYMAEIVSKVCLKARNIISEEKEPFDNYQVVSFTGSQDKLEKAKEHIKQVKEKYKDSCSNI